MKWKNCQQILVKVSPIKISYGQAKLINLCGTNFLNAREEEKGEFPQTKL
jgi:hypothetical protein